MFPIDPSGIAVVHPIDKDVIDLSPQEIGETFGSRKQRSDHGVRSRSGAMKPIEGIDPLRDGRRSWFKDHSHLIVAGCDAESDFYVTGFADDIGVSHDKRRAGLDNDGPIVLGQYFQAAPTETVGRLHRLVGVADSAEPDPPFSLLSHFFFQNVCGVHLDVDEFTPRFLVPGESFHEPGVAISAAVLAAPVRIDDIVLHPRD